MKKKNWLPAIAAILAMSGSGCASTETRYKPTPLPLPERPLLPAVEAEELQCISADAYGRLVTRQRLLREYAEDLEIIIKSTRNDG